MDNKLSILIVEDEPTLNELITSKLKNEGNITDSKLDGLEAYNALKENKYDLVILDVMLPGMNGFEIVKAIREEKNPIPILLLTARDSIEDRVNGLNIGADEYLIKPFAFSELLARIRLLMRRTKPYNGNKLQIANLCIDFNARTASRGDTVIELATKEFDILEYMVNNRGVVLTRDRIGRAIWSYDYMASSNLIDVYIRYLRRKIDDGYSPKLIHTVRGTGYLFGE